MNRKIDQCNTSNKKPNLKLQPIEYINCEICSVPVYNYRECLNNWTYCSNDCYEILYLNRCGTFNDMSSFNGNKMNEDESISDISNDSPWGMSYSNYDFDETSQDDDIN